MTQKLLWLALSLALSLGVGVADNMTGHHLSLSLLYVGPILLVLRRVGTASAYAFCLLSAGEWFIAKYLDIPVQTWSHLVVWDAILQIGFFLLLTYSLSNLHDTIVRERENARIDALTGAANARRFFERAEEERQRSARSGRPFTVAYIDLDNFKPLNDRYGHATGDIALRMVADTIRASSRLTDLCARMGGDEFALLLSDTDEAAASDVLERIRHNLAAIMQERHWPVSCSIGAVTFRQVPPGVQEMLTAADDLMYEAKRGGKDQIRQDIWPVTRSTTRLREATAHTPKRPSGRTSGQSKRRKRA